MRIILLIMIGLSLLQAEYLRDDTKEIVLDTTTSLMWQDDATPANMNWTVAIDYCEALNFGGFNDWRLPSKNELKSIADKTTFHPAINSVFQNVVNSGYWSSTTYAGNTTVAWNVHFNGGNDFAEGKSVTLYIRCVR